MDASSYRCRWVDIAPSAAIGFLIGSIVILSFATIYPTGEEPLQKQRGNENMKWVVVLDGNTVYNIPPATHPLTANEQGKTMTTDRLDRRTDGHSLTDLTKDIRVTFIAKGDNRTIEIDCGRTPFMRTQKREDLMWKLCVGRHKGRWREGSCEIDSYLDRISVDELACAYQWGKFPFRSPSKIESLLKDKPIFEVHRSIAADQHTSTSIDSIRILIPAAFLLSSIGIAIALVSSIMRSASRYGNDVKNPILPN